MKRVRFDGRGRLHVFGYELKQNETVEMTDQEAAQLAANPHVPVTVLGVTVHGSIQVERGDDLSLPRTK